MYDNMKYNSLQSKVLRELGLTKVVYEHLYTKKKELGYTYKNRRKYEIHIANDAPSEEVKSVVLLHEAGHIYYGHNEVNMIEEFRLIENLCKLMGKDLSLVGAFGGLSRFLNICMDMEVNSKLLTKSNVKVMKDIGFPPCLPSSFKVPVLDSFRDYYRPMLESLEEQLSEEVKKLIQIVDEDLAEGVSSYDEELDETRDKDIIEELQKEEYEDGELKNSVSNPVYSSNVKAESESFSKSGKSTGMFQLLEVEPSVKISRFLKSILTTSVDKVNAPLRHYNRGTRRNPQGIIYNSKKNGRAIDRQKLAIVVDVSGSMSLEAISVAMKTLQSSFRSLDPESIVLTFTTEPGEEFKISSVPNLMNASGGTDMAKALRYLKDRNFDDIIIYSDFMTDLNDLKSEVEKSKARIYGIFVNDYTFTDNNIEKFLKTIKHIVVSNTK